jgi:pyruvate/2-oxoglutarate dehydrogenase complex dihydrolipoamide dehydrogenase (E3) component
VKYRTAEGAERELALDGIFVAIGSVPRGELPGKLGVKLDARGQVDVDPRTMATSVDGVFAAGDVTNASGSFKQIVTGAAQGAIAATSAYLDVQTLGSVCRFHAVPVAGLLDTPENCHAVIVAKKSKVKRAVKKVRKVIKRLAKRRK